MAHAPSTSHLLQLIDALNRSVDPEHHTRLIADALQAAGLVDLPADNAKFRDFVSGPLRDTARALLGEATATELTWTLMRMTSVRAPSSRSPSQSNRARPTVDYSEDAFVRRTDVIIIDPAEGLYEELRIHLEARDYSIQHTTQGDAVEWLDRDAPPRAIVLNVGLGAGFSCAAQIREDLGDKCPPVVVLAKPDEEGEAPDGVQILPRGALAPLVTALIDIVGSRQRA